MINLQIRYSKFLCGKRGGERLELCSSPIHIIQVDHTWKAQLACVTEDSEEVWQRLADAEEQVAADDIP